MGIETAAMIALAVGTAVSAGASIMAGQRQKQTANAQAELSRRQAAQERDAAVAQAEKIRRAAAQQQAEATTNLAAAGVSVGAGTPLRISNEIYKNAESDAYQTILSGRRAYQSGMTQAGMLEASGRNAATSGYLNAASSVLSGAGQAARSGWFKK
ncbi:hypothetical protein [Burkholderia stagnalis]|uniref:hypothetical protein n=1 Tax=Burkholderia stagnalis TaxID=1503054 RepID=UPI000AD44F39|nr:hypothetical protein [Burkholderia stagnalis]